MGDRVAVLIADDSEQVRSSIRAMLSLEEGFLVVGEAPDGPTAVELAKALRPDVVLVDVNMPGDGIAATAKIMREAPCGVVIISVQSEADYLRRAMRAGARDYLIKPFTCEELVAAVHRAATSEYGGVEAAALEKPKGRVITILGAKGGVGKSTLTANLAASLALKTRLKIAAVDLDLEFGILASLFGARPAATWLDLSRVEGPLQAGHVERVLARPVPLSLDVLAAPPYPHQAAEVDGEGRADRDRNYVAEVLDLLRSTHDYILIDTGLGFRESVLTALDRSDAILSVTVPEVPALQNTAKLLDILLERLEYPRERVELVLNFAGGEHSLPAEEVARSLGQPLAHQIPADPAAVVWAANAGQPVVLKRGRSPLAGAVAAIAQHLIAAGAQGGTGTALQSPVALTSGEEVPGRGRPALVAALPQGAAMAAGAGTAGAAGAGAGARALGGRRRLFGLF